MRLRMGTFTAAILAFGILMLQAGVARAQLPPMSSIIIDARSGQILYAANADQPRYPASLTKLMTLYMLFEALRDHRITLNQLMPVSAHAASVEPVKLDVAAGGRLSVEEAILGMVTLSANDAATTAGEFLAGGDETRFGALMTLKAHTLGMNNTVFRNASGLPDPYQVTTAHDVSILARRLIQVPTIVLPNLILGANAMPEFIQADCTPRRLADALAPLAGDGSAREAQVAALERIDRLMGLADGDVPSLSAARIVLGSIRAR